MKKELSQIETSLLIEMAWADEITFQSIEKQFNLSPSETVKFMRANLKRSSFVMWRKRTAGNKMKSRTLINNKLDFSKSEYRRTYTDNKKEKDRTKELFNNLDSETEMIFL